MWPYFEKRQSRLFFTLQSKSLLDSMAVAVADFRRGCCRLCPWRTWHANDRVWNALQKHCLADPDGFARYYSNQCLALVSTAWLGPHYQFTAQVNRVRIPFAMKVKMTQRE